MFFLERKGREGYCCNVNVKEKEAMCMYYTERIYLGSLSELRFVIYSIFLVIVDCTLLSILRAPLSLGNT